MEGVFVQGISGGLRTELDSLAQVATCRWCKGTGMVVLATTTQPCLDCIAGRASAWIVGNDTGVSSRTIHGVMLGLAPGDGWGWDAPWDADDFGRCARLIDLIPEWGPRMHEVGDAVPAWRPIVDEWDALKRLCDEGRTRELDRAVRALRGR